MPTQVPMGTKSQVSASLWTILMMDKAGLFIDYPALGLKTKKISYFKTHFTAQRVRQKCRSMGWWWIKWKENDASLDFQITWTLCFGIQVVTAITLWLSECCMFRQHSLLKPKCPINLCFNGKANQIMIWIFFLKLTKLQVFGVVDCTVIPS